MDNTQPEQYQYTTSIGLEFTGPPEQREKLEAAIAAFVEHFLKPGQEFAGLRLQHSYTTTMFHREQPINANFERWLKERGYSFEPVQRHRFGLAKVTPNRKLPEETQKQNLAGWAYDMIVNSDAVAASVNIRWPPEKVKP